MFMSNVALFKCVIKKKMYVVYHGNVNIQLPFICHPFNAYHE